MNILFLTLVSFDTIEQKSIYTDLLREFVKNGHEVYAISPVEKREGQTTHIVRESHATILRLQIGDTQKTGVIKKGINTVLLEKFFKKAIKKYFSEVKFDLVMYSTPPITLTSAIEYVKKRDGAKTYLLLKDIFPQNAVDIGLMSKTGIRGLLYRHFRNQEKKLYRISDRIGCMSQANVNYVTAHNQEINSEVVEVCPNSIEIIDMSVDEETRIATRTRYGIPLEKRVFVYGGNLGKPQGIPFLIECLQKCSDFDDVFFVIVGDGTEYGILEKYATTSEQKNLKLMKRLSKNDYDTLVGACDVGMIFLDHRFTIPNFPSRLLSYLQAKMPVLAVTDPNTDIKNIITGVDTIGNMTHAAFGWWCESDDEVKFAELILEICRNDLQTYGLNGYNYLKENYSVKTGYEIIARLND